MRYVVTGGAGFIGSHIVQRLVSENQHVVVLDDFSSGRPENLSHLLHRITLVEGSIRDPQACRAVMQGADFVLHQAAVPSVPRSIEDPLSTHEACATGTLNVLLAARDAGVERVVYAGSSSAYGNTAVLPKREEMSPNPRSPYAVAKLAGEHYARAFTTAYGLETVVLRYFNIFGPRQDPDSPYGAAIPKFIAAATAGRAPVIFGDGQQTRDFTYVDNAVTANLLACRAGPAAVGEVFNVGCGDRVSVNELWGLICELLEVRIDPAYAPARAGDVRDSLADISRTRELLGYAPVVGLRDGLRKTIEESAWARAGQD